MGTSRSSSGPGAGVPMVPPWVPDLPTSGEGPPGDDPTVDEQSPLETVAPTGRYQTVPVAPHGRFRAARSSFGRFARDGELSDLESGIGHYVRRGYGGARTATRRMGGTVSTAAVLYGALSYGIGGESVEAGTRIDLLDLQDKSADETMDALIEAVRPIDGTLDSEATRGAIRDALSDLLNRFPDADLLVLSDEERIFAVERFVALGMV